MSVEESQAGTDGDWSLSAEERARFERDGYIGPFVTYQPDEIRRRWGEQRRAMLDQRMAVYAADVGTSVSSYDRHLDNAFLAEHVCRPDIVDKVCSILGPDVVCWRTEFFPKYPGDEGTDWHQARTFGAAPGKPLLEFDADDELKCTLTVWTAFSDATEEMACLQFIPGTHRTMFYDENASMDYDPARRNAVHKQGVLRGSYGYDYRDLQFDSTWMPDESKAVPLPMRAGEFVVFTESVLHAALPHLGTTDEMRLGYAARYVPASTKVYPGVETVTEYGGTFSLHKYGAVLVAGSDRYGHNKLAKHTTRGKPFACRTPAACSGNT